MDGLNTLEIFAFTDPVCTWCWGSEPVLRKLQLWYGDRISIRPVMGGLVEDIRAFYDRANDIGGDPEQSNTQIARHWLEASERHGMPVRTEGFRLFSAEAVSTYPQNIAYKAVELCAPELAAKFLRRIREASAAEARETCRYPVLIELVSEMGVDVAAFIERLEDRSAEQAFRADLDLTRRYHARGFPTFLLRWQGEELLLRGYRAFREFQAVITTLTAGKLVGAAPEKSAADVLHFLRSGRAAPVELMATFGLSPSELNTLLGSPDLGPSVRYVPAGNGGFWEAHAGALACETSSGVCAV